MKKIFLIIVSLGIIFLSVFYLIRFFLVSEKKEDFKIISNLNLKTKEKIEKEKVFENNFYPPILAFHNVSASLKEDKWGLTINTQDLEKKLIQLKENNYQTVFISEIAEYIKEGKKIPNNLVALTFDDGTIGFYTEVLPLLKKHNMKASLYIMTGVRSKNYVNSEQIKEIAESNLVEIGSHTVYHQRLAELSEEDQLKELKNSKIFLENLLNKEITVICYPYGSYTEKTKELAKEVGYLYGLDFNAKMPLSKLDLLAINRIGLSPQMDIIKTLNNLKQKNNLVKVSNDKEEILIKEYLKNNIQKVAINSPILGGSWYVVDSSIDILKKEGWVLYEDGHIQSKAFFSYQINSETKEIIFSNWSLDKE